jgi:hypothetical protein
MYDVKFRKLALLDPDRSNIATMTIVAYKLPMIACLRVFGPDTNSVSSTGGSHIPGQILTGNLHMCYRGCPA